MIKFFTKRPVVLFNLWANAVAVAVSVASGWWELVFVNLLGVACCVVLLDSSDNK